jgi:WD40 repeat protein
LRFALAGTAERETQTTELRYTTRAVFLFDIPATRWEDQGGCFPVVATESFAISVAGDRSMTVIRPGQSRRWLAVGALMALLLGPSFGPQAGQAPAAKDEPIKRAVGLPEIDPKSRPLLVTDANGHSATVNVAFFHPNGENVITVSKDKTVRMWDLATGETLQVFRLPIGPGSEGALYAGDVSPDGRLIAVGGMPFGGGAHGVMIHVISLESGQVEAVLKGHSNIVVCLAFSRDGRFLASSSNDGTARLYDVKTGETLQVFRGHTGRVRKVAFSHDDKYLATSGGDRTARIWSVADGKQVAELTGFDAEVLSVAWHPKAHTLATGCDDGTIHLWQVDGKRTKKIRLDPKDPIQSVSLAYSPDGDELLYGGVSFSGRVGLYNLKEDKLRLAFTKHNNTVYSARFSPDGKLAITSGGDDHETIIWKTADAEVVQKLQGQGRSVWGLGWRLDGKAIAWGNTNGSPYYAQTRLEHTFLLDELRLGTAPTAAKSGREGAYEDIGRIAVRLGPWSLKTIDFFRVAVMRGGEKLHEFKSNLPGDRIYSMSLLPGDRAIIGASFGLYLVDLPTNTIVRSYRAQGIFMAVSPSPDGKCFLSGSIDQTISLWDPEREDPLVSLFVVGREWIAWTPQGQYACSAQGERLMGWQINHGPERLASFHPAARFHNSLYQPNLIRFLFQEKNYDKALVLASQNRPEPIQNVNVSQVLPPSVSIIAPTGAACTTKETAVVVRAKAKSTGEHPITALRLLVDGRPYLGDRGVKKFDPPKKGEVEATWTVDLLPGKHSVAAVAESSVSKGVSSWIEVTRLDVKKEELPNLYVVAVGISAYPRPLALNYAHRDAIILEKSLKSQPDGVFRKVETRLLTDHKATRANILDGLAWLKNVATPKDVSVLFLAGHGTRDDKGRFHFIPVDVKQDDMEGSCVSGELLKKTLANMPGRVIVLLDACHSGAASRKNKGLTDDLVRDLVSEDTGVVVMCSSQGAEFSLESKTVEHGFFTLGLVEALTGRADFNSDRYIYLHELDYYAYHRVRQLSDGAQHPTTGRPAHLRSFPLAKVK